MGKLAWFFLLIGILQGWSQAQTRAGGTATGETHNAISSSLVVPPLPRLRTPEPAVPGQSSQLFQCDGKVTLQICRQKAMALKPLLDKYGADRLGQWKWVLVSSQQWEMLLAKVGLSPSVPAFTVLDAKVTFFDDALIAGSPERLSRLMDAWHLGRNGLLDLAVRHELGHAFCKNRSEVAANRAAQDLETNKPLSCQTSLAQWNRDVKPFALVGAEGSH